MDDTNADSQIVLCCYQAVNVYYYKYTVDGMNVILINMLPIVIAAILIGFIDKGKIPVVPKLGKFLLALAAIIPLAYCIGMAVTR
jgi:Ca2+/H+ antiporter